MPKSLKIAVDVLLIAVPLIAMTYFLARPDAFNAFLNWTCNTYSPGSGSISSRITENILRVGLNYQFH